MNLRKPARQAVGDATQLTAILLSFYDAIVALQAPLVPSRAPNLKSMARYTFAEMRAAVGDVNGELGPRLAMVAGKATVLDGGEGVFAWDPDSTLADDSANVLQVSGVAVGRWRRTV